MIELQFVCLFLNLVWSRTVVNGDYINSHVDSGRVQNPNRLNKEYQAILGKATSHLHWMTLKIWFRWGSGQWLERPRWPLHDVQHELLLYPFSIIPYRRPVAFPSKIMLLLFETDQLVYCSAVIKRQVQLCITWSVSKKVTRTIPNFTPTNLLQWRQTIFAKKPSAWLYTVKNTNFQKIRPIEV
jgi:hypothetical protein